MDSSPSQQVTASGQDQASDSFLPGLSTAGPAVATSGPLLPTTGDKDEADESTDESDPSGFSFSLVQPCVSAVKQAIGWEETEEPPKKSKSFHS